MVYFVDQSYLTPILYKIILPTIERNIGVITIIQSQDIKGFEYT